MKTIITYPCCRPFRVLLFHVNQWMKNEYEIWTAIENREWEARGIGVYFMKKTIKNMVST